ncbi:MAG TPA: ABC transporter ATP-binding protein, partial [Thiotrichales bacterium]|nr:ABC transporter ATP-binding protein [Thiotrichales bacterium]
MLRNDMLIQAEQLMPALTAFEYEGNALDIAIRRGEIVSLIGPDYSGKSDWLRTLTGV